MKLIYEINSLETKNILPGTIYKSCSFLCSLSISKRNAMLWLIEFAGCQFKRQAVEGLDLLFLAFRVFALFYLAFISWPTDHHTTNGILLPKLVWSTVRKNCSSDQEKLLKFEAEVREFEIFLRSLEQFIQTVKGQNNFW